MYITGFKLSDENFEEEVSLSPSGSKIDLRVSSHGMNALVLLDKHSAKVLGENLIRMVEQIERN